MKNKVTRLIGFILWGFYFFYGKNIFKIKIIIYELCGLAVG